MKVLFFTNIPSPYRVDFFNELGKFCDLTVIYERSDADDRDKNWLKKNGDNNQFKSIYLKGKKVGADTALCPEVIKYWKSKKYDVKIVGDYATPTGILSCIYMRLHDIPYGIECDGGFLRDGESNIVKAIKKLLFEKCMFVFSPSEMTDEYVRNYGVSQEKIYHYPFTSLKQLDIDNVLQERDSKKRFKEKLGIKEEKMILSVGQMIYRKGFDILLESIKSIGKDVGVYIIGGVPKSEYVSYVEEYRLDNVHFLDFMQKEKLSNYYLAADVFVLPTREDIWGLVIGEAMSFGLPIVTTDKCVAGVELLKHGGGIIVPIEDVEALSRAIRKILDDSRLCAKYAKENIEKMKEYTIENMAIVHIEALKNIKVGLR